jgi:predicted dehydrogenase
VDRDADRVKIYGDRGTLVLDTDLNKIIEIWPIDRDAPARVIPLETVDNCFKAEWLDFYSAIAEGKSPRGNPEDALIDLVILDAGRRSAVTGKTITL